MANRDVVFADQDLAHDKPDEVLALFDGQVLGVRGEPCAEPFERFGELEVGLGVVQLGVERVQLGLHRGLALAQLGRASAQFLECDQLLLVAVKQPAQRGLGAGQVALQCVSAAGGGVRRTHRL